MKSKFKILLLVAISLMVSCGKEIGTEIDKNERLDPTTIAIKLLGPWKITGFITLSGVDYYNTKMPDCEKDNIISYINDNVSIDESKLKCNINTPQLISHKILFGDMGLRTLAGNNGEQEVDFDILLLNDITLKLKSRSSGDIITYTKQANVKIVNPLVGKWITSGDIFYGVDTWALKPGEKKLGSFNTTVSGVGDCEKDDIWIFTEDGKMIIDEGKTSCAVGRSSPDYFGTYTYKSSDDWKFVSITTPSGITAIHSIVLLKATTLRIMPADAEDKNDYIELTRTP